MSNTQGGGLLTGLLHFLKTEALSAESAIGAKLKAAGEANGTNIIGALETTASDALAPVEAMTKKYLPVALGQVVAAAKDPNLLDSEKRSGVLTKLLQQLETDGHDIESEGIKAFGGLLVELAVNIGKTILPKVLGAVFTAL